MGLPADRNLFLLLLKRGPRLIIKTFPVFLALFLSPHIPNFVSGLIFYLRLFVLIFYQVGQTSVGSIGETE